MREIKAIPFYGDIGLDVKEVQRALNELGFNLTVDGIFGPKTKSAISEVQKRHGLPGSGIIGPKTLYILSLEVLENTNGPSWYKVAKEFEGKKETDPEFNKFMSAKWPLVGLNLGTISKSWAAWCGLAIAVALSGAGYKWQKDGAAAKNWAKYGKKIEWQTNGIPQGSIIHMNHVKCGSGSSNHVAMADGDCTAQDLLKKGATINLYGGNQSNQFKVSTFSVSKICAVRWPSEDALPPKVEKSVNCNASSKDSNESTQ
jgi:Putative peptidoglycan binding domain